MINSERQALNWAPDSSNLPRLLITTHEQRHTITESRAKGLINTRFVKPYNYFLSDHNNRNALALIGLYHFLCACFVFPHINFIIRNIFLRKILLRSCTVGSGWQAVNRNLFAHSCLLCIESFQHISEQRLKLFFDAPHTGHLQSSGKSSNRLPFSILPFLSPLSGL